MAQLNANVTLANATTDLWQHSKSISGAHEHRSTVRDEDEVEVEAVAEGIRSRQCDGVCVGSPEPRGRMGPCSEIAIHSTLKLPVMWQHSSVALQARR